MNVLMKKYIFLLRWMLLVTSYLFSGFVVAGYTPLSVVTMSNQPTASANTQTDKKTIAPVHVGSAANSPVFVFVDTKLADYETLVKDIQNNSVNQNVTIVFLDPDHNGVQQITDTLANQTNVAAIHLLTHGMAGSIQLGDTALNLNTIDVYREKLIAWRKSLAKNADILIYGCNVTSTDAGLDFIKQIGDLTHTHVAASTNVTGNASFGADWNLESHYGNIKTNSIISAQTQQSWDAILAYSTYISIGPGGVDQAFKDTSNVGTSFSYDSPGATYSVNRVAVQLKILAGADTSQNITLCLRNSWNGANITSASMATTLLTTSYAWYAFNFNAVNLNDNQVYYIQIYTLSSDLKTVANTWNSSQWNSNTELYVGVTNYPAKELTFIMSTGNTTPAVNSAIPDQSATKNVAFSYQFASNAFTDSDTGDQLTYTATLSSGAALPAWLSFNATTRTFSGTPTTAGTISVKVTASDFSSSTNDTFDIVVNTVPVVANAIPDQTATESSAFSFQFASNAFTDADGDTLTYSATLSSGAALPAWLTFTAGTRTFSGTPANGDIGTISVKVTANDGKGGTVTDTFDIVISPSLHHYGITLTSPGVTCAGSAITITAYNSGGTAVAPPNGTVITLSTSPATGSWVGGNTATFDGVVTSKTKYLQQTTASTLNINVTDGTHSESASIDPNIVFDAAALNFYGSTGLGAMPNQIAGTTDSNPILKVTNCSGQVNSTTKAVSFGYECRNPTSCVAGQTLSVNSNNIQSNANGASITYSATQNLAFNASGIASIPINYTDVGKVKIYASMTLAASGNDPAITLTANSGDFIVKPHTLIATAIQTAGAVANPGGSSVAGSGAQFVSAGTAFTVKVEVRNSAGNRTPNFGNETTTENNLKFVEQSLVYPSGGTLTALTNPSAFSATTPAGTFINSTIYWNQVGSFTARPELADNDYLGAGDVTTKTTSGTIGRFYPDHFTLASSSTTNSCSAGGFTFMGQPGISFNYVLQAQGATNSVLTNYGGNYSTATVSYVAENNNSADGASYTSARLGTPPAWSSGAVTVASSTTSFPRQTSTAPDGPYASLQYGLVVSDSFDSRSLQSLDMNALTTGVCSPCTAKAIGNPLNIRYGRLRLDSASGPETVKLPVNFLSEYWSGNGFILNANDSCTVVPLAAITYPSGTLATAGNFTVPLSIGNTVGTYTNSTGGVHFVAGNAGHYFSAPSAAGTGSFVVGVDLTNLAWLRYDWNQNGNYSTDTSIPNATYKFGSYRGNDRIIYWHERF